MDTRDFDAAFWRRVSIAFDRALELDELARERYLTDLDSGEQPLANQVRRMLCDRPSVIGAADNIGAPTVADVNQSMPPPEPAFDQLLQRALRADRMGQKSARHVGEQCGPWRLEALVGTGGMGEVWGARRSDGLYDAKVAIKFLHDDGGSERFIARFDQERALLARLDHPNIARLLDAGRQFGTPYLVLEYVEGLTLLEYVARERCALDRRIELIEQIASAVVYAHRRLVVHRDIKPSNVLVTQDGQVKLLDFGVAGVLAGAMGDELSAGHATEISGRGMTLHYAAPELITGEFAGVSNDVYSLSALAYHVLTGRRAYLPENQNRASYEHAVLHTDPLAASLAARQSPPAYATDCIEPPTDAERMRGDLDAILAHGLRRDVTQRYQSVEHLVSDLTRWRAKRPISVRRAERFYRVGLWFERNWVAASLAATAVAFLIGGLVVSSMQYLQTKTQATRAEQTMHFLAELLRSADPEINGGRTPTVIDLLERAAQESRVRFADNPATEMELASMVANTYLSLNRDADAIPIARRAAELSETRFGNGAIETLRAKKTLSELYYRTHDFAAARSTLEPVVPSLLARLAPDSEEAFEIERLNAETLCAVFAFDDAKRMFERLSYHPHLARLNASDRDWTLADLAGIFATCIARSGDWLGAANLLQRHSKQFEHAPPQRLKTALYHRELLLTVNLVLGSRNDVETVAQSLIAEWRRLAGDKSNRIDAVLMLLGQHYQSIGDAQNAEAQFRQLIDRNLEKPDRESGERLQAELGLLETQALFNRATAGKVLADLDALVEKVRTHGNPQAPRFRQFFLRAALVALTYSRADIAARYAEIARIEGRDNSPSSPIREMQVEHHLSTANGNFAQSIALAERRIATFDARGERMSYRRAKLHLAKAYAVLLSGAKDSEVFSRELKSAISAAPTTLMANDVFYIKLEWLQNLYLYGENSPITIKSHTTLARWYGRMSSELPRPMTGLFLL